MLADLSILAAGAATTTIYPSNTAEECQFIIEDSATRFVFVEDLEHLSKLMEVRDQIPNVAKVIVLCGGNPTMTGPFPWTNWPL